MIAGIFLLLGQHIFGKRYAPPLAIVGVIIYTFLIGADAAVSRAALMGTVCRVVPTRQVFTSDCSRRCEIPAISPELQKLKLPVILGSPYHPQDGLIGYFKGTDGDVMKKIVPTQFAEEIKGTGTYVGNATPLAMPTPGNQPGAWEFHGPQLDGVPEQPVASDTKPHLANTSALVKGGRLVLRQSKKSWSLACRLCCT